MAGNWPVKKKNSDCWKNLMIPQPSLIKIRNPSLNSWLTALRVAKSFSQNCKQFQTHLELQEYYWLYLDYTIYIYINFVKKSRIKMDQVVVSDTETFSEANEKPLLLELQCSSKGSRWLNQDFAIRDEGIWKKGSIL